jgi:hypothetical protein
MLWCQSAAPVCHNVPTAQCPTTTIPHATFGGALVRPPPLPPSPPTSPPRHPPRLRRKKRPADSPGLAAEHAIAEAVHGTLAGEGDSPPARLRQSVDGSSPREVGGCTAVPSCRSSRGEQRAARSTSLPPAGLHQTTHLQRLLGNEPQNRFERMERESDSRSSLPHTSCCSNRTASSGTPPPRPRRRGCSCRRVGRLPARDPSAPACAVCAGPVPQRLHLPEPWEEGGQRGAGGGADRVTLCRAADAGSFSVAAPLQAP